SLSLTPLYFSFCLISHSIVSLLSLFSLFFFNDTATTEIYTLSLHDALPILSAPAASRRRASSTLRTPPPRWTPWRACERRSGFRSEEHTSELQSLAYLVCRLLLEKKKIYNIL